MKTQMESLIHHFKIVTEGFAVPAARCTKALSRREGRWVLRRIRWNGQALPGAYAQSVIRHAAGGRNHVQADAGRRGRGDRFD